MGCLGITSVISHECRLHNQEQSNVISYLFPTGFITSVGYWEREFCRLDLEGVHRGPFLGCYGSK
jgi:hypothetical protein